MQIFYAFDNISGYSGHMIWCMIKHALIFLLCCHGTEKLICVGVEYVFIVFHFLDLVYTLIL